jgi:hypothetical protein
MLIELPGFINFGWAFRHPRVPYSAGPFGMPISAGLSNTSNIFDQVFYSLGKWELIDD